MAHTIIGSPSKAGKGRGLFRHPLLRVGAAAGIVLVVTFVVVSATSAARRGASSAPGVQFFQGVKTCTQNSAPPLIVCDITTSNVALLQNAAIAYVSNPVILSDPTPGRIESDVILTTAVKTDGKPSTASGHCTFYFATGTGECTYTHGTNGLAGFHATLVIGTIDANAGTYSAIGKYWFGDNNAQ